MAKLPYAEKTDSAERSGIKQFFVTRNQDYDILAEAYDDNDGVEKIHPVFRPVAEAQTDNFKHDFNDKDSYDAVLCYSIKITLLS